jgi:hypothetical protein
MVVQTNRRQLLKASVAVAPLGSLATILPATPSKAEAAPAAPGNGAKGARLTAGDVQILFADLQVALVAGSRTMEAKALAQSAGVLAKVAALLGLPTLFSMVPEGGGPPHLLPELVPYARPANTLARALADPFMDDATAAALAAANRKTLVIAGFSAEGAVLQGVLGGTASGYSVQYVVDAVGGHSDRTEAAAFRHMERTGAVPTSVLSPTTRLAPDFFHSPGSETFAALKPLLL